MTKQTRLNNWFRGLNCESTRLILCISLKFCSIFIIHQTVCEFGNLCYSWAATTNFVTNVTNYGFWFNNSTIKCVIIFKLNSQYNYYKHFQWFYSWFVSFLKLKTKCFYFYKLCTRLLLKQVSVTLWFTGVVVSYLFHFNKCCL